MIYWEEMQSKWGFGDGERVPTHVEKNRTVYIQLVNKLAEILGSTIRAVAYDRAGVHNWCLILLHKLEDLNTLGVEPAQYVQDSYAYAKSLAEEQPDDAMNSAISFAQEHLWDIDDSNVIQTTVTVNEENLTLLLNGLADMVAKTQEEVNA